MDFARAGVYKDFHRKSTPPYQEVVKRSKWIEGNKNNTV